MPNNKDQYLVRVILPYAAFAALWIYLSDWLPATFVADPALRVAIGRSQGIAFVLITALLLYLLLQHQISRRERNQHDQGRLAVLPESTGDGCFALDNDGRFTQVDSRAAEILRQQPEDLIGKHAWTFFPPAEDSELYRACKRARQEKTPIVVEDYSPSWKRWYEIRVHPKEQGLVVYFRDITEHKLQELALHPVGINLDIAHARVKLGIWELDIAASMGRWSAEMYALFGRDPTLGPPLLAEFMEMVHPEDRPPLMAIHRQAILTGQSHAIEFRSNPDRGPVRHFRSNLDPIKDSRGRVTMLSGTLQDISARKQVEAALQVNEQTLAAFIENIPLVVFIKDARQLRYVRVNRCCEELIGMPRKRLLGCTDHDIFPPEQAEFFIAKDRETLAKNEPVDIPEESIDTPLGRRLMHTRKVVVRGADGQPRYLLGIAEDITERRRMEIDLAEKQARLAESQRIAHIGSWSWELGTDVLSWSDETYRLFGVSPDTFALNPESFFNLIHSDDRAAMQAWLQACAAGNSPGDLEFRVITSSGGIRVINGRGVLYRDAGNRPIRMVGTGQDITERKRVVQALHEREEVLRLFVEHSPAAISMFDNEMRYLVVSRRWISDYSLGSQNIIGRSHYEVFPEIPQRWKDIHKRCLAGATVHCDEEPFVRADGHIDWVKWEICPWYKAGGAIGGVVMFTELVTARKQAEEMLRENARQLRTLSTRVLEAQESERRRLARELHDELGQILTAIKINLQARDRLKVEPALEFDASNIQLVEDALQQVRRLALALRPSMLDDLGLVPALRWMADQQAERSGFALRFNAALPETRLAPEIETACFRIAQEALTNIARHAQAARVTLDLHREDSVLVMTVQDNGCGFDVAEMRERAKAGDSIGMLGMQERTALLGGRLELDSTPGQGTILRVRIPLHMTGETV